MIVNEAFTCQNNDGSKTTYPAGYAYAIELGHDYWGVSDSKAVAYEFNEAWVDNH